MGWKHLGSAFKSTLIVLLAFALVVIIRIAWMDWSGEFTMPFIRTGRYVELLILFLIGMAVAIALTKLLQWEFHTETKPRSRRRRR